MGYADAVTREVAWLQADLSALPVPIPPLTKTLTGPFDLIKAYGRSAKARINERTLLVSRERVTEIRFAFGEKQQIHQLRLRIGWPIRSGGPEDDLAALDVALEVLLTRIRGPIGDKTHGNRFLSVAEGDETQGPSTQVEYDDPETLEDAGRSTVTVRYLAADIPFPA